MLDLHVLVDILFNRFLFGLGHYHSSFADCDAPFHTPDRLLELANSRSSIIPLLTHLLARHVDSGDDIRCDVYVERIARLEVITRTKYLYLDDPYQVLSVQAFDAKGEG